MIIPVGCKNFMNFGNGSKKAPVNNITPSPDYSGIPSEKDIFITGDHGVVADYIQELVDQGYEYTAACEQADRFARCLESHQNV